MLRRDPANLQVILGYGGIAQWLRSNEPDLYDSVLGGAPPAAAYVAHAPRADDAFDIEAHIRRIQDSLVRDPMLALGSTKELLESVFKVVLGRHGVQSTGDDLPKLLKRTQIALGLDPKDVLGTTPGDEAYRRLLGSIQQIVISVYELRNMCGTGHGRTNVPQVDDSAIRLAVGAGTALAAFLIDRYKALKHR